MKLAIGTSAESGEFADGVLAKLTDSAKLGFLPSAVRLYHRAGRIDEARSYLNELQAAVQDKTTVDPSVTDELAMLEALVADAENKPYAAILRLESVVVRNPQNVQAWLGLWRAYGKVGQSRRGIRALEEYVSRAPNDSTASLTLAIYYSGRDWGQAFRFAQMAERADPTSLDAKLLRMEANAHVVVGLSEAADVLAKLSKELESLRTKDLDNAAMQMLNATFAMAQDRPEDAEKALKEAAENSDDPLVPLMKLVGLLSRQQKSDAAIEVCREAARRTPKIAEPWIRMAQLQVDVGKVSDARSSFEEAADRLDGDERARLRRAQAAFLIVQQNAESAISILKELAEQRSGDLETRAALLSLPRIQDDEKLAGQYVEEIKAIEGASGLIWNIENAKLILRRPIEAWTPRQKEIADMLEYCIDSDPGWAAPVLTLGGMYEKLGDDARAEQTYRRLTDYSNPDVDVASRLLDLLERRHRLDEADRILSRLPSKVAYSEHRISVAMARADYAVAIRELRRKIARDPHDGLSRAVLAEAILANSTDDVVLRTLREGIPPIADVAKYAFSLLDEAESSSPVVARRILAIKVALLRAANRTDEAMALLDAEVDRSDDFSSYLLRAQFLLATGRTDLAERDFLHLMTFTDKQADAYRILGGFFERLGELDRAIASWEEGLEKVPGDFALSLELIKVLIRSNDTSRNDRGRRLLKTKLEENHDSPDLLLLQAGLILGEKSRDIDGAAKKMLEKAIEQRPTLAAAHVSLVKLAAAEGDMELAERLLARALAANPTNSELLIEKANVEQACGRPMFARQIVKSVLDGPEAKADPRVRMRAGLCLADIDVLQGQHDTAMMDLLKLRGSLSGEHAAEVLAAVADYYCGKGKLDEADRFLSEAVAASPENTAVLMAQMSLMGARRDFNALRDMLARLRKTRFRDIGLLLAGAEILVSSNDADSMNAARDLIEQVLSLDAGEVDALFLRAGIQYATGDIDAAERDYRAVLQNYPRHPLALNNLAWILLDARNNPAAAIEFADRAVKESPKDPNLLDTRGAALTALGRYDEACHDLENALSSVEDSPASKAKILWRLGIAMHKKGDPAGAGKRLEEAMKADDQSHVLTESERDEARRVIKSVS